MALNFNLLNTELPGQIATGAMRGYQGAQDRATELAQRQQQSQQNALKIAEAQRTEQSQNALNKAYSQSVTPTGTTDYNKLIGSLAAGGVGEKIPAIQKAQTEQLTAQSAQQKAKIDLIDASLKQARSFLDNINPADPNAPALYRQWHRANHSHPVIGPELASRGVTVEQSDAQIEQAIAQGPQAFADLINKSKLGTEKFMEMNKMTPEIQTMTKLGYPITQEGFEAYRQAQRPEQLSFEQRKELARAGRSTTAGGGRAPSGYRFTTSGELEAIPGGPAAAPAVKPMTELQQRKADKERVDELQGVKAAKSTANELEKLTDELAGNPAKNKPPHPGYEKIIGIQASIPSLPGGDAKRAEQKLETFKGKIATFGRQLATQYGKLGNMAVQEWKIVADSIQNINPAAGNLDEQMRDVVRLARDFEKSMQERYDALPGNNSQQPATPATTGNLSPAEQTELDQLRKKFGK
jgi:hypothetical protein